METTGTYRRLRKFTGLLGLSAILLFWLCLSFPSQAQESNTTPTPTIQTPDVTPTSSLDQARNSITATIAAKLQATLSVTPPDPTPTVSATVTATTTATPVTTITLTPEPEPEIPTPTFTPGPDDVLNAQIDALIANMSVADRVGQLFVITFEGDRINRLSDIAALVQDYRVGGVVLSPANGNFSNAAGNETPEQVITVINQLQALAYGLILPVEQAQNPPAGQPVLQEDNLPLDPLQQAPIRLPLLIGVEQVGDGLPGTALRQGFTPLPSEMALGATWQPELARKVGAVVGRELSIVGVNFLLGPSLDVLEQPRLDSVGSLGLSMFGGDPYWVGLMGRAYVAGVHEGSGGHVATIATHFPGQGGSDRRPNEEVATIRKSLQELRRIELPPFASVTQRPSSLLHIDGDPASTDGLMSSHVRYSGFQGSRERTPPISLAAELGTILALDEFATWRRAGGLLMSDALGVPAVRRYYDPALESFPHRRIALDAFLAGNDLLYLARFSLDDRWESEFTNIKETISFFRERYTSDPDFAMRVDTSLRNILRLKLRLYADRMEKGQPDSTPPAYPAIPLERVLVTKRAVSRLAEGRTETDVLVGQVAREAITILYPELQGISDPLPTKPQKDEQLVIFTDSRSLRECATCPSYPAIAPDALESIMLRLYGLGATGQLRPSQVSSFTFEELNQILNDTATGSLARDMERQIEGADWLIFAMLDMDPERYPSSDAVKQFLRLRGDRLRGQRIVVLAFGPPYYLDATEVSKLTAYFGLYSKIQPFLETGVRALFEPSRLPGAPPVSVAGTRFNSLLERLEPDPDRVIGLSLLIDGEELPVTQDDDQNSNAGIQADLQLGDVVRVRAGPILDLNGHRVPDGTVVNFRLIYEGDELALPIEPMTTRNGVASIDVPLEHSGNLRISVSSGQATVSTVIVVSIHGDDPALIAAMVPTATPQSVTTDMPDPGTEVDSEQATPLRTIRRVDLITLSVALSAILVVGSLLLVVLIRVMPRQMLASRLLWSVAAGLVGYILYGLGALPGSTWLQGNFYPWGGLFPVLVAMIAPLVWLQLRSE